jgi:hypothetical protein
MMHVAMPSSPCEKGQQQQQQQQQATHVTMVLLGCNTFRVTGAAGCCDML